MTQREAALDEAEKYKREWLAAPRDGVVPNAVPTADVFERDAAYKAFDHYLRTGEIDRRTLTLTDGHVDIPEPLLRAAFDRRAMERNIIRVSSDVSGGLAVVPSLAPEALVDAQAQSALRGAGAPERLTDGDVYEEVVVSGDTATWAPEVLDGTENPNPDVDLFSAPIKKIRDLQFMSEAQRDDQRVDLTAAVVFNSVDNALRMEDSGLINGSGVGNEPLGMLNAADLPATTDISGTTAETISNTLADQGSTPKILTLQGTLPSRFHADAAWICAGSTFAAIKALVNANGDASFPEARSGKMLLGSPVHLCDGVPVGGVDGNKVLIYGAFNRGFRIARKPAGISIRLLNELYAGRDLVGIRVIYRVGGGMILPAAFRVGRV
jgi:HK97 family phage major capsid protein